MKGEKNMIKSVDTTCKILEVIQERNGAGVTELADELNYAKSTIHKHLAALETNDFLVNKEGRYTLSLRFLAIADHVKEELGIYPVIKTSIDQLAKETGEVSQFAIEENGNAVPIYKSEGEYAVQTLSNIGKRENLHSTALGKAILANLPRERVEQIIEEQGLKSKTPNTITNHDDLLKELEQVKQQGYAIDDEENVKGLRCVGAPVTDADGQAFGALSISGPARRLSIERTETELKDQILGTANVIEINSRLQ